MDEAEKARKAAEAKMDKAQRDLVDEESREAETLKGEADALHTKAEKAGPTEQKDLEREAEQARLWQKEAEWEADASRHKNQKGVAAENVAEKNAYEEEKRAMHDAERDAYANGENDDPERAEPPDPNDPEVGMKTLQLELARLEAQKRKKLAAEQAEEAKEARETFKEEKDAEEAQVDDTNRKAYDEQDRNSTALRIGETEQKLREEKQYEARHHSKESALLSIDVQGFPFVDQHFKGRGPCGEPAKLAEHARLLKSDLHFPQLPLEAQAALMTLLVPGRKKNLKHFL